MSKRHRAKGATHVPHLQRVRALAVFTARAGQRAANARGVMLSQPARSATREKVTKERIRTATRQRRARQIVAATEPATTRAATASAHRTSLVRTANNAPTDRNIPHAVATQDARQVSWNAMVSPLHGRVRKTPMVALTGRHNNVTQRSSVVVGFVLHVGSGTKFAARVQPVRMTP